MSAREVILEARGLDLRYFRRSGGPVLARVDLEIGDGEFWLLLGPNGSGKTTLLRALLGAITPSAGTIRLHPRLASRERIGFVPQRCDINPTLPTTVREFVSLGLVGIRAASDDRRERLAWALAAVGLGDMERRSYWSLSGGQRQRALVARALVRRPSFVVLDEPTSGLDLPAQDALLRNLRDLNETQGITVLCVTHNLTAATIAGTHVALCAGGRLEAGPIDEMMTSERLESTFGVPVRVERSSGGRFSVALGAGGDA